MITTRCEALALNENSNPAQLIAHLRQNNHESCVAIYAEEGYDPPSCVCIERLAAADRIVELEMRHIGVLALVAEWAKMADRVVGLETELSAILTDPLQEEAS